MNRKRSRYDRWRSKIEGGARVIFPPRHSEGYEKGVKKEMKGLRGGKLSFIKRKIGSRLSECNISTDSFGGNISSLGKNSIKSRRWGRKVRREGDEENERERKGKRTKLEKQREGRKHAETLVAKQRRGGEEVRRRTKISKKLKKLHRSGEIFISYRAIFISLAAVDPFNVTVTKFNLIDRSPRSFITSSKLHR